MARLVNLKKQDFNSSEELFETRCKLYSSGEIPSRKVTEFLKKCKKRYVGNIESPWKEEDKEWKLEILDKYFPGQEKIIRDYAEQERLSQIKREEARVRRQKLQEMKLEQNKWDMLNVLKCK